MSVQIGDIWETRSYWYDTFGVVRKQIKYYLVLQIFDEYYKIMNIQSADITFSRLDSASWIKVNA